MFCRIEKEIETLEREEFNISINEGRILNRLKAIEKSTEDIIKVILRHFIFTDSTGIYLPEGADECCIKNKVYTFSMKKFVYIKNAFVVIECDCRTHLKSSFEFHYRQQMKISSQVKKLFLISQIGFMNFHLTK